MPLEYYEAFGYTPESDLAQPAFNKKLCPFVGGACTKQFKGGIVSGSCSLVNPVDGIPVPVCPKRLYAENYKILQDVVNKAWGEEIPLVLNDANLPASGSFVLPFGQGQGKEIRIPNKIHSGSAKVSIDWMLALVSEKKELKGFVAVEIQTIDTTGNYHRSFLELAKKFQPALLRKMKRPPSSSGNFNFRNVQKRILPQLIGKGQILRREHLCDKGLFFICPSVVFDNILGSMGALESYPMQAGGITFISYMVDKSSTIEPRPLVQDRILTTTSEQLAVAFASATNLPPQGVYETQIRKALVERIGI